MPELAGPAALQQALPGIWSACKRRERAWATPRLTPSRHQASLIDYSRRPEPPMLADRSGCWACFAKKHEHVTTHAGSIQTACRSLWLLADCLRRRRSV